MTQLATPSEPQQARSRATRQRLLEATVEALVDKGYAGASTTVVARRAGVSQGALYKHFPTKPLLLREALAHIFSGLIDDFRRRMRRVRSEDRLDAAMRVLWKVFTSPPLLAAFELYLAARTDPELAEAMRPVLEAHQENILAEAEAQFPELSAASPELPMVVRSVMNLMQGAALARAALPLDPVAEEAQLASFRRLARRQLGLPE